MQRLWVWLKFYILSASWLVAVLIMYAEFRLNPPSASTALAHFNMIGSRNLPGEFERTVFLSIVELVILSLLLRPWSTERLPSRLSVAIGLLLFWMVLFGIATMNSGGISRVNLLWMIGIWLGLLLELAGLMFWEWLRSLRR
ncbi:hypothetical protein IFO70_09695 [Phormidium tenue FACHB-886]|nr:hypothetical protein [Phormidium tenue FACHB-886]